MEVSLLQKPDIIYAQELLFSGFSDDKYLKPIINDLDAMFNPNYLAPEFLVMKEPNDLIVSIGSWSGGIIDFDNFNIFWVCTRENYRNKGYASVIVNSIIKRIINQNKLCKSINLSCVDELVDFYKKLDFCDLVSKANKHIMGLDIQKWSLKNNN